MTRLERSLSWVILVFATTFAIFLIVAIGKAIIDLWHWDGVDWQFYMVVFFGVFLSMSGCIISAVFFGFAQKAKKGGKQ
jgi:hypothetical protein